MVECFSVSSLATSAHYARIANKSRDKIQYNHQIWLGSDGCRDLDHGFRIQTRDLNVDVPQAPIPAELRNTCDYIADVILLTT